jgi:hypothetical protein
MVLGLSSLCPVSDTLLDMEKILTTIGFVWALPVVLLSWLFYVLPFWALGYMRWDGWASFLVAQFLVSTEKNNWFTRAWKKWAGMSLSAVIVLKMDPDDYPRYVRTRDHELQHAKQSFMFGIFHPIGYVGHSALIWLFQKDKHAYLDNWFERDARRAAGQLVDIPRDQWMQGPDDRWPWWVWPWWVIGVTMLEWFASDSVSSAINVLT